MALPAFVRRCAVGLCAMAVLATTTAPARGDDANPLLELVDGATQRLQTADPVAASKWKTGGSIEDPQRVEQGLRAVSADAAGRGVDVDYVRRLLTQHHHAHQPLQSPLFRPQQIHPATPTAC